MRSKQQGFTVIELLIVVFGVAVISAVVCGLYVLGHFISKFW